MATQCKACFRCLFSNIKLLNSLFSQCSFKTKRLETQSSPSSATKHQSRSTFCGVKGSFLIYSVVPSAERLRYF
jgi:hypothetical protein